MSRYSLEQFLASSAQRDLGQGVFELERERILEVNLSGLVWMKRGAMIAYHGDIKFTREGVLEHGLGKAMKKFFTGEGTALTKAEGAGKLYLADGGKKVAVLQLQGEAIVVNGSDLLAFEPQIKWDIRMMRKLGAMLAGGLFNVRLEGAGLVAITTHFEPLALVVQPGRPVFTDPGATVAWSGSLEPEFKTDVSLKTFFGRGSGESIQMRFEGDGFVIVQPYEPPPMQANAGS
jgi:uncharacterized protein (AIM24 family)